MRLCGNILPWVSEFKHLGNTISNVGGLTDQDIVIKRAQFISKNIEIRQEFYFASARTKFLLNQIYNTHFTGSPLWDLFGNHAKRLEGSYNLAVKNMFNLPLATHRHLISPVTNHRHIRITLISRFLSFIHQLKLSEKSVPRMLFYNTMYDVRSTTGRNLRKILLETDKCNVDSLSKHDVKELSYHETEKVDLWKENILTELIDTKEGSVSLDGFEWEEMNEIIEWICAK